MKIIGIATVAALLIGPTVSAQGLFSFESCPVGPLTTCSPPEAWQHSGGIATVVPFGAIGSSVSGFPTDGGSKWCIPHAINLAGGPASGGGHTSPPGGPAPYPFPSGSVAQLKLPMTIPIPPVGFGVTLIFDYTYVTPECPSDATYNDFFTVDFTVSGTQLLNVLYVDTFTTGLTGPALSPNETGAVAAGFCGTSPTLEVGPPGTPKRVTLMLPPNFHGQMVDLEFNIGNGNDNQFPSYAYIDNVDLQVGGTPTVSFTQAGPGAGVFLDNGSLIPANEYFNIISLDLCSPVGSGPYLGLCFNDVNFAITQLLAPIGTLPFHFIATATSTSFGPFALPATLVIDALCLDLTGGILGPVSNVARYTVQ